jgi:chromosome segregation ATPase
MTLSNEAAYLYVYSKKLFELNKSIKKLTKKAHKHREKHSKAKSEGKKLKHRTKHFKLTKEIKELMKNHNKTLTRLKHHQVAFAHMLQNEHKI